MDSKSFFSLISFILFLFLFGCFVEVSVAGDDIYLTTEDGIKLKATYFAPQTQNAPAVILIPDTRCDRMNFGTIPRKLNEIGYAVLAIDLRYKDLIAKTRSRKESIETIQKQDLAALVNYDLNSGLKFLESKIDVNSKKIVLIGSSLGSRVALISGVEYNLSALVLLSLSGELAFPNYRPIKQLVSEFGEKPILFMTAKKDWGGKGKGG